MKKNLIIAASLILLVFFVYSTIQLNNRYSPEVSYKVLEFKDIPPEVLDRLDGLTYDPFEDAEAMTSFKIKTDKDTYIFIKPPVDQTIKVLKVETQEVSYNTIEYVYTSFRSQGVSLEDSIRIIKLENYHGKTSATYTSSGE